ncbi:hypothetical protein [Methylobacterium brachiatum]
MAEEISYSVALIEMRIGSTELASGSCFIYERNERHFIVTAWHNLAGRNTETLKLLSKTGALPDNILVHIGNYSQVDEYSGFSRRAIVIPLQKDGMATYLVHTQKWPRVDVAVIPIDLNSDFNQEYYLSDGSTRKFATPLNFKQPDGLVSLTPVLEQEKESSLTAGTAMNVVHTIGDDLFLIGFPSGLFDHLINPIWKRASFATHFDMDWSGEKMFLVDSASRQGMSGCVALYYDKTGTVPVRPGSSLKIGRPIYILLGVYAGRYGDSEFEAQVGRVWKMTIVDEIIDSGSLDFASGDIEIPISDARRIINEEWPTDTAAAVDYVNGEPRLSYFVRFIMEKIDGRLGNDYVKELIEEIAREKIAC